MAKFRAKVGSALFRLRTALFGEPAPRVAILRFEGVIASGSGRVRGALNLQAVERAIDQAFAWPGLSAVALVINSPGGSPVQSALIADRLRARAGKKDIPVIAFAEDVAASGGYVLALAGDEIYAHEASVVGSIGVIAGGFGFAGVLDKLGIERRVYTAGEKKVMLDPFQPEKAEDVERVQEIQSAIHDWFKAFVRERRGKRLKGPRARVFSGEVFLGGEAVKLGLADGLADMESVMRERFGETTYFRSFSQKKRGLAGLFGLGEGSRAARGGFAADLLAALEEHGYWSRFGL